MSDRLKAIMVGCGGISGRWLSSLQEIPEVEVIGLVDLNIEAAKKQKELYALDSAETGTDAATMIDLLKPDIVFDLTIPESHFNITTTALQLGCHVLGEKPLADSMENAKKMVAAAEAAGKKYAVMQNRRYDPNIRAYKSILASGDLGTLTTLNCDFYIGAHFGGFRDRMKHVLILDMAIHTFDAARLISGADPISVYCHEWNPKGSWYDHDASAIAIFEMSNGVVFTYRGSWCAEGLNTTWESDWRAICEKGSVKWDGASNFEAQKAIETKEFFSKWENIEVPIRETDKKGGHTGCIRDFVDSVLRDKTPETICTDNIKSLAMVFGAIESAESKKRVEIKV